MIRWSYKTVHFEQKKEGLLGNTYIDEVEIEETLNDFGMSGWELVSVLDVRDGVVAVLKQPLGDVSEEVATESRAVQEESETFEESEAALYSLDEKDAETQHDPATEPAQMLNDEEFTESDTGLEEQDLVPSGVGSIRIE